MIKDMRFLNKALMKQQGNTKELFTLIMNNPDLPIVAWVDSEIVADDGYMRWQGSFGSSHIIEYISVKMYREYPEFVYKDDTEYYENYLYDQGMSDKEVEDHINSIEWIKAIAVNIDLPE